MNKYDERDTMFARMSYKKDSCNYEDYYKKNPHLKETDDDIRTYPNIAQEGTVMYNPIVSPIGDAVFNYLADIKKFAEGEVASEKKYVDPNEMTHRLKELAKYFGAKSVGICEMKDYHYYSHRGRHPENYGEEVGYPHKFGIVFTVEMDKEMMMTAPKNPELVTVVKGYLEAANVGMVLSYYLRELGFDARNHMDGNYLLVAPLVAHDAGLGEFGRNGLLITKEYGARIRLGVVTTDIPLVTDKPEKFGLEEFCNDCNRCSKTCPGRCISADEIGDDQGIRRWKIKAEECYRRWRSIGTDCGICIANCPFSYNIDKDVINQMKDSEDIRKQVLEEFSNQYGVRPKKDSPDWL